MLETNDNRRLPKDKYNLVLFIVLLQGVGVLMPWNMFITARSYFADYKLSTNHTEDTHHYATYFISYVAFAAQIPNLVFNWINVFINVTGSVTPRIVVSITLEAIGFIITIVLTAIDTSETVALFFWITMATVVLLNMAGGIFQNTVFGMAAALPSKYSEALILGCNVSGAFVSLINLLTQITTPTMQTSALYYFITSLFVLMICLATYFAPQRIVNTGKFYKQFIISEDVHPESADRDKGKNIPYWKVFRNISIQLINVFLVYFVTLSIFPGMQAEIRQSDPGFIIPQEYYEIIMCFLTFNTAALLGALITKWVKWPHPEIIFIPILLRGLFIPFFFFCNYQPTNKVRKAPVMVNNDWLYWFGSILLGFTSGFLGSKAMIYTTRSAESAHESIAGKFGSAVLVTAVFLGVMFSTIFPVLAEL